MRYILIILFSIVALSTKAQFTGTDSLRNYNNRYITTNPATAFTNNRLNTLLRGIIDFIDTARAGGGGAITLGIDTVYAVNDSTIRYRKNGVFRQFTLKGVYDSRRKVDTMYTVNDTTIRFTINGQVRNIILPGQGGSNTIAKSAQTADGNYIQNWNHKWLYFNNLNSLNFISDDPDPNHPQNRKIFQLSGDSTIDNYPFRILWGLKNINNDFTDSLHFELTSTKDLSYLYQYTNGGSKSIEMDWDPNSFYPSTKIYAIGNSKSGYYELGASVATIQPNDSVLIKAVPAATSDSVLAVRALSNGVNTIIKIPASAIGGSTTLNNVGTGFAWATTPNGSIKRFNPTYGLTADSATANTITIKADTSSTNHLVTQSDLNDAVAGVGADTTSLSNRINQKAVITQLEGIIYNKSVFTSTSDFTQRGSFTASVSSNAIAISGGNNDFAETLDLDTTMRERWVMHIEQKVGTISSTSDGLGIGVRSVNPNAAYGIAGILVTNNTGNGGKLLLIDTYNTSVITTSTSSISFSAGDTIVFELERDRLLLTLKGWNKTTGSDVISVQYLYSLSESPSHVIPNSGTFSVFNVGGSHSMTALTINSKETKYAPLFIAADSKAWYYAGTNSWGMLLDKIFRPTNAHAGPADRLIELLATEDELIALSPVSLAISIGSNDIGSGYSVGQTFTRYKQYVARAEAAGINVFHLLPLYQPTIVAELDSLADSIRTQYPTKIIDCRTVARRNPSFFLAADNVHPNEEYNTLIYNTIVNAGLLASYYKTPNSTAASLDEVLTVGNSSSQSVNLTGVNTSDSKLKVGPLEVQPYSLNNAWVAENTYYNGSDWVYRSNGFAERFHFQNGFIFFETAPSGSAGGSVPWKLNLLGDHNGNIGIGGMNPSSPTHANAYMNVIGTSGKVNINGVDGTESKFTVGTFELSPHALHNVSLAENAYFDGTDWKRRLGASGASMLHYQNGVAYISNAGTGSAGSNITWVNSYISDAAGNVGIGNIGGSLNYVDASLYIPAATGKVHIETMDSTASPANMVWRDPNTHELKLAAVPSGGGNGIYGGSGSLPGNVTVTGGNNSITWSDIFAFNILSDYNTIAKANGSGIYTEAVIGSGNIYEIGYTPAAGVFSKGAGVFIDTNNNVGLGTQPPTTIPLYANGASTFIQGLQSNQGNFYRVSNFTADFTASLNYYFITIDAQSNNVTMTLPAASTAFGNNMGINYVIQRIDNSGNTVTVQRAGSDTINGTTSFTLGTQWETKNLTCTSTSTWAQH